MSLSFVQQTINVRKPLYQREKSHLVIQKSPGQVGRLRLGIRIAKASIRKLV